MAVRSFNGTSDFVSFSIGGNNITGAFTLAALVKPLDTTVPSNWQAVMANHDSGNTPRVVMYIRGVTGTGAPQQGVITLNTVGGAGDEISDGATKVITATAGYKICVISKAAGNATARLGIYSFASSSWTLENTNLAQSNPNTQASGTMRFGTYNGSDFAKMQIALAGEWAGTAMSDAQIQALSTNLSYLDWTGHAVTPTSVIPFNQSSVSAPADLVGSSSQSAISGTSVTTGDDPPGFTLPGGSPSILSPVVLSSASSYAAHRAASI